MPPFTPDPAGGYLYDQVALYLEGRIRTGYYQPGARLPNVRELAAELGVAEHTVRHAQRLLADWGYVRTLSSKGNYILPPHEWRRRPPRRGSG